MGGDPATWANLTDVNVFANAWRARFTNPLPNALDPKLLGIGFVYRPDAGSANTYTVTAGQTTWDVLGPPGSGLPSTRVWGYGNYEGVAGGLAVTFPGRSFVVQRGAAIHVNWVNNLAEPVGSRGLAQVDAVGNIVTDGRQPLAHLFGVDQSVTMQNDQTTRDVDNATGQVVYSGNEIFGVPVAIHHHGGDSNKEFDGGPDQWNTPRRVQAAPGVIPGTNANGENLAYTYDNGQEASMHWYHDHAEGVTRINAYAGLAGLYVVRDANEGQLVARKLIPSGPYEVPLVLQDKCFTADGSLAYSADVNDYPAPIVGLQSPTVMPEVFGDINVVSGVAWPNLDVEPREYRLRLLNGSDSRFYNLRFGFGGTARRGGLNGYLEVYKISTDLGFLNAPVQMPRQSVLIAPGERMDIVVDFSKVPLATARTARTVVVTNDAATPYPLGAATVPGAMGPGTVMQFNVKLPLNAAVPPTAVTTLGNNLALRGRDPATPRLQVPAKVPAGTKVRRILLAEGADEFGRIMPQMGSFQQPGDEAYGNYPGSFNLGTMAYSQQPTETPRVGTTEIWEMWNTSVDAHPLHMHLVQFRILGREAFGPSTAAPIDPATGLQVMSEAKDMVNGWSGSRLVPQYVQLSGAVVNAPAHEQGWKDTVICYPGEVTRLLVSFPRTGKFVMHCHILSHEEHDMMRWYEVV